MLSKKAIHRSRTAGGSQPIAYVCVEGCQVRHRGSNVTSTRVYLALDILYNQLDPGGTSNIDVGVTGTLAIFGARINLKGLFPTYRLKASAILCADHTSKAGELNTRDD